MSKSIRQYKIVPSKSVFVDVDSTLIEWPSETMSFDAHPDAIEVDLFGTKMKVLPMIGNIAKMKSFFEKGYEVVVWSLSSKQWAEYVIAKLGLQDYVDFCVSKPDFFIDDREVTHFMLPDKRIFVKLSE